MATVDVRFDRPGIARDSRAPLEEFTCKLMERCLEDLRWSDGELSILYCSGAEIRRLNREFREMDKETDVLSFPSAEDAEELRSEPEPYLGDLALCLKVCAKQAPENARSFADEVALLLVHGLLHLLGFDHDTPTREREMWAETDRLLALAAEIKRPALEL